MNICFLEVNFMFYLFYLSKAINFNFQYYTRMGLFSFFKNAGKKVIKNKHQKSAGVNKNLLLEKMVKSLGIEIKDLKVELFGDSVTVFGEVHSQSEMEKVILAVGNVKGISSVESRMIVKSEESASILYEVQSGDTLSKIAKAHYGDPMKYTLIFEANEPLLKDPDKIYPGQVLRIPSIH